MANQNRYVKENAYRLFHDAGHMTLFDKIDNSLQGWIYGFSYSEHPQISFNDSERTFEVKVSLITKEVLDEVGGLPNSEFEQIRGKINEWLNKKHTHTSLFRTNMESCIDFWNGANEHNLIEDYKITPPSDDISFNVGNGVIAVIKSFNGKCHPHVSFTDEKKTYEIRISLINGDVLDYIGVFKGKENTFNDISNWLKENFNECENAWNKINAESQIDTYQDEVDPHLR